MKVMQVTWHLDKFKKIRSWKIVSKAVWTLQANGEGGMQREKAEGAMGESKRNECGWEVKWQRVEGNEIVISE